MRQDTVPTRAPRRLSDEDGASVLFALLFFMVAAVVAVVVLTASSTASGQLQGLKESERERLAAQSTAETLGDTLSGACCNVASGSEVTVDVFGDATAAAPLASVSAADAAGSLPSFEAVAGGLVAKVAANGGIAPAEATMLATAPSGGEVDVSVTVDQAYNVELRCTCGGATVLCSVPAACDRSGEGGRPAKVLWMQPVYGRPSVAAGTGARP